MANHRKTETASKLKKFYSVMTNAIKLSETEWGIPSYEWEGRSVCGGLEQHKQYLDNYILKHINYLKIEELGENESYYNSIQAINKQYWENVAAVYLNDGSLFFVDECVYGIVFDVNGERKPNQVGKDIFSFYILSEDDGDPAFAQTVPRFNTRDWSTILFQPEHGGNDISRSNFLNGCRQGFSSSCTALVEMDGWEFKEDYPYKL